VSSAASSRRYRIARSDQVGPASRVKEPRLRRATIEASSREREGQACEARKKEGKEEKWKKLAMVVREQHYRQGTRREFSALLVFQSPSSESGHLRLSRSLALSRSRPETDVKRNGRVPSRTARQRNSFHENAPIVARRVAAREKRRREETSEIGVTGGRTGLRKTPRVRRLRATGESHTPSRLCAPRDARQRITRDLSLMAGRKALADGQSIRKNDRARGANERTRISVGERKGDGMGKKENSSRGSRASSATHLRDRRRTARRNA